MKALVTGATGFIGGRLAARLVEAGHEVRGQVRDRRRAGALEQLGYEIREGNVLQPLGAAAGRHGRRHRLLPGPLDGPWAKRRLRKKDATARAPSPGWRDGRASGGSVYLGGLGEQPKSKHLQSRHETAQALSRRGRR